MDIKTIYALLAGTASIEPTHRPSARVSPDSVMDALRTARETDAFAPHIMESSVIYDTDQSRPGWIRQTVQETGEETYGRFVDGEFVK